MNWTPEHVEERLIESVQTILRTTGRVGPRQLGNSHLPVAPSESERWQSIVGELETLWAEGDYTGHSAIEIYLREIEAASERMATKEEMTRALEAARWCAMYLVDSPQQADAVSLWALCKATGRPIEKTISRRQKRADRLIGRAQREAAIRVGAGTRTSAKALNRGVLRDEDALRESAKKVHDWLEPRIQARIEQFAEKRRKLASKGHKPERLKGLIAAEEAKARKTIARLKQAAAIRMQREGAKAVFRPLKIDRRDIMPGKVLSKRWLNLCRAEAAAWIAAGLNRDGVEVR